jgi:hypothetical protein
LSAKSDLADLGLAARQGFLDCVDHNARATAVVVKARNTSMTASNPLLVRHLREGCGSQFP